MKKSTMAGFMAIGMALSACEASQNTKSAAPNAATQATANEGSILLASGDASGLAGSWSGPYVFDNGFRGETKLHLTSTNASTVEGYFEYFWSGGNYDRFPDSGTIAGVIKEDGKLHFGTWDLAPFRQGDKLEFKTRQDIAGKPARLKWGKTTPPLPSEKGS